MGYIFVKMKTGMILKKSKDNKWLIFGCFMDGLEEKTWTEKYLRETLYKNVEIALVD